MRTPFLSLHHVTATVSQAQPDLDFYRGVLGLRLVKRTVNFDNPGVYHFYYATERGDPGTLWTTFPYHGQGVGPGRHGAGQVTLTSFSVPARSLDTWRGRLQEAGVPAAVRETAFGETALQVRDPSGLLIELVGTDRDDRPPWPGGGVGADTAARGLHSVTLSIRDARWTIGFLTGVLGFEVVAQTEGQTRLAVASDGPGHLVNVWHTPDQPAGRNGLGTVHHVAFAIRDEEAQHALRQRLLEREVAVTPVLDRQYFRSIYFREPGGVLFEAATVGPGFTVDEDLAHLGGALKLPPWEEPRRNAIEARLPEVVL